MNKFGWWAPLTLAALFACDGGSDKPDDTGPTDADTDTDTDDSAAPPASPRVTTGTGGGVVMTADETIAVVANRTSGEIAVMAMDLSVNPATGTIAQLFDEGDGEPFAAVISNDDDTAYVLLRNSREVVQITDLHGVPQLGNRATTDSEPSGLAISPNGSTLYVTNWGAGTVTVIDTATMLGHDVDLNQALVDTGTFGAAVAAGRTGLARPYAIAITNNGDDNDDDETVYVTEFFGQDIDGLTYDAVTDADGNFFPDDDDFFDVSKQGFVYTFVTGDEIVDTISLAPIANTGFTATDATVAGCYPNQLYGAAISNGRLYVTSMCASPRGPADLNFKQKVMPTLFVIDTATNTELASESLVMTKVWEDAYVADGTADDGSRRFPLIPNALAFVPSAADNIGYITAYGSDAVFRIDIDGASGFLNEVGSSSNFFMDLGAGGGKLPYGIWVTPSQNAVVVNENTRNLTVLDLNLQAVEGSIASATAVDALDPNAVDTNEGRKFFVTGMGRWSLSGQGWGSCEGCHPHGLTDNVTWFFGQGPRQSTSLEASHGPNGEHRLFNWTAIFDEMADFEGNTRGQSGGVGAIVWENVAPISNDDRIILDTATPTATQIKTLELQAGLNGAAYDVINFGVDGVSLTAGYVDAQSVLLDWNKIDLYTKTIRAPNAPTLDPVLVATGEALFTANSCNGCHGGDNWTISRRFYTPNDANNDVSSGNLNDLYGPHNLPAGLNPSSELTGTAALRGTGFIQCVLRDVGTFPATGNVGVTPPGAPAVSERKQSMVVASNTATGILGFNPPSLLGASAGAPYFHAGNARTLEEVLSTTFEPHHQAFATNFDPSAADIEALVAFMQSIDDDAVTISEDIAGVGEIICPPSL